MTKPSQPVQISSHSGARAARRRKAVLQCEALEPRMMLAENSGYFSGAAYLSTNRADVPVASGNNGYTIEAWVKRVDASRCEAVVSSGFRNFVSSGGFFFGVCGAKPFFNSNVLAGSGHSSATTIPANLWTHIAVTWSQDAERFYVNGELDLTTLPGTEPNRGQTRLYVGATANESPVPVGGGPLNFFNGNIAEARMWDTVRSQEQIRHSMHELTESRPAGLVGAWHLSTSTNESLRNLPTTNTSVTTTGPASPPVFRVSEVDANFNKLAENRSSSATATVTSTNTAYLLGGRTSLSASSNQIVAVDMATGASRIVGTLPIADSFQAAAYVPVTNSIYVFGGRNSGTQIVKYNLTTGVVSSLATLLPANLSDSVAVWHPKIKRIVLLGGNGDGPSDAIQMFDPVLETLSAAGVALPESRYAAAATYSAVTDRIYLFGGYTGASFGVAQGGYEIQLEASGTGAVKLLPLSARLPLSTQSATAVEDPDTRLIHILGGTAEYVQTFDPMTGETWRSMIRMPRNYSGNVDGAVLNGSYQSVAYSPRNRHALVIGGFTSISAPVSNKIWRVALGDGPAVPLERWEFPNPVGLPVSAIDGDDRRVIFGTSNVAAPGAPSVVEIAQDGTRSAIGPRLLGGTHDVLTINDVGYYSPSDQVWVATSEVGAFQFTGSSGLWNKHVGLGGGIEDINSNRILALSDGGGNFATDHGLSSHYAFGSGYLRYMEDPVAAYTFVDAMAYSPVTGDLWGVTRTRESLSENQYGPPQLRRVAFDPFTGLGVETNYQSVCGTGVLAGELREYNEIAFDPSGNLWIVGTGVGGVQGANDKAICYIPAGNLPGGANRFRSFNGEHANDVTVDAEGRVWVAFKSWNGQDSGGVESGGLTVWESSNVNGVTTTDYNWRNAPIGSRRLLGNVNGIPPIWDSGFSQVAGVDEKIWATRGDDGEIATLAQRWGQADGSFLNDVAVNKIFTARGRVFFSSLSDLTVLQPDGATWDTRTVVSTSAVMGDSRGNTWVGAASGVQLYLPEGWDTLADRAGTRPTGQVAAIVESRDEHLSDNQPGPIWIGGQTGLTLFDRNRFIATFTTANSGLPNNLVTSLIVDRQNRLWVGTRNGLAMLSADRITWTVFKTANGLVNNWVSELAEMGDGRIAISTIDGLSIYNGTGFVTQTPPIPANSLPLTVDERGRLWAGSAVLTVNGWQGYWYTNSGLQHSTVSDNAADSADRVWFSHAPNPGVSVRGAYLPPLKDFQPTISGFTPRFATSGQNVVITGNTFGGNTADVAVTLGSMRADAVSIANTRLEVRVNDNTTSGPVSVERSGRSASFGSEAQNTTFCAVPQVRSLSLAGGSVGMEVTITGSNFDPDAMIQFGEGPVRKAHIVNPTQIRAIVTPVDGSGRITVYNHCATATDVSDQTFRVVTVSIPEVVLNQGMSIYGIVQDKPTLIQSYISTNGTLFLGERIEIDELQLAVTGPSGFTTYESYQYFDDKNGDLVDDDGDGDFDLGFTPPFLPGPPSDAARMETAQSLNMSPVSLRESGATEVRVVLRRHGYVVAEHTTSVTVAPNHVTRVLLVPFMLSGSTPAEMFKMRNDLDAALGELRRRIMPFGTVEFDWSPEVVYDSETFSLDKALILWDKGHAMDRARRHWNDSHISSRDVSIAFGIVDKRLVAGTTPGYAFANDVSEILNKLGLNVIDTICDVGDSILSVFDLSDGTGCSLDFPTAIGWVAGGSLIGESLQNYQAGIAATIGHEIGHINGLVRPYAYNGSFGDNLTHSVNDEIGGDKTCAESAGGGVVFDWAKTLYNQPGVRGPVVSPLAGPNAAQLRPQPEGNWDTARGKAIMSYACTDNNNLVFFEPADLTGMNASLAPLAGAFLPIPFVGPGSPQFVASTSQSPQAPSATAPHTANSPTPVPNPGPRLHVSGLVNAALATGDIRQAEVFGEHGPLTPSFATDIWLVQLDAAGIELARLGVFPIPSSEPDSDLTGFFAATMVRQAGVSRVELRLGGTILDTFTAGAELPIVEIVGPLASEEFAGEEIPVSFIATDADGDELSIVVEYSSDDGATWTPAANAAESGTVSVLTGWLSGAPGTARVRISASDGLNTSSVTSEPFTVAAQLPRPYIVGAEETRMSLEGQWVVLSGGALDNQDGTVTEGSLRWSSDVEGFLGIGEEFSAQLHRVGWHIVTLEATNSRGLSATTTFSVYVEPDYDFDGISDATELANGINLLSALDAYSDADGDGLSYLVELKRGLDAASADSDGDGRTDDVEVAEGTNPLGIDESPIADQLAVSPTAVVLAVDLKGSTPLPQQVVAVLSRNITDWTMTSSVDWLEASVTSGTTPASVLLRVQAYKLSEGIHTAELIFQSTGLGTNIKIPVTVTVGNRSAWFDTSGDGQATSDDCLIIQAAVGSTFGEPAYNYRYDIDRDGSIESTDVATCYQAVSTTLAGDFDSDSDVDADDIDLLFAAVRQGGNELLFDLSGDQIVNDDDVSALVAGILATRRGDANLDGHVDRRDASIVATHFGGSGGWASGDFNGDLAPNLADLAILQSSFDVPFAPSAAAAVGAKRTPISLTTRRRIPTAIIKADKTPLKLLDPDVLKAVRRRGGVALNVSPIRRVVGNIGPVVHGAPESSER